MVRLRLPACGPAPADTGAAPTLQNLAVIRQARAGCPHIVRVVLPGKVTVMDLDALETSFDLVAPRGDELVDQFYSRLFAVAPAVKPLFANTDMARQKQMLLSALVLVRKSLRDLDAVVPTLRKLGARHAEYGAEAAHYPVVGAPMTGAMAAVAGAAGTRRYSEAWTDAFGLVASTMLAGAAEAQLPAAA